MTTVGVLGGGQLGRMLALAGAPLGLRFRFLDPDPDAPASALGEHIVAAYDDPDALAEFADGAAVVTYEFENVPARVAEFLSNHARIAPNARSLAVAQDRAEEKALFARLGVPAPRTALVDSPADLPRALAATGLPAILKTRRLGYDGKGQSVLRTAADAPAALASIGDAPAILEAMVPFEREVSLLAARSAAGQTVFYPLAENVHRRGVLIQTIAPAPGADAALQAHAEEYARRILDDLAYVGVLAIEFFVVNGALAASEVACRVHNSGHWTIEGSITSQFENHLRAILGLPLGAADALGAAAMVNLLGATPPLPDLLAFPGAHVHLYGKSPRPGRKIGHVTLVEPTHDALRPRLAALRSLVDPATRLAGGA